jgi:ferredoxin
MADSKSRHAENVPGPWYVDSNRISCGLCGEYAAASFRPADDGSQNIVYCQPTTAEELAAAFESKEGCPVDAIGNDG